MGADQSRSRDLVLQSAAGNVEGVRQLLAVYLNQQRHQALLTQLPPNQRVDINYQLPEGRVNGWQQQHSARHEQQCRECSSCARC